MLVYPDAPIEPGCVVLFIPVELVPIVGGAFKTMEQRRKWATQEDFEQGYRAFADLEAQLMNNCLVELIAEIRAIRGVKPEHSSVPVEDRTTDMYRDFNDIIGHLNTMIFGLTGGIEHDDSILMALRGTVEASETRNVIEEL